MKGKELIFNLEASATTSDELNTFAVFVTINFT